MRIGAARCLVDGRLIPGDVEIDDGRIARVGARGARGTGIAVPGFIDLQVNGFAGVDLFDADETGYLRVGAALLGTGVTSFQPTFITAPEERLVAAVRAMPSHAGGVRVLGAHLEGPFLSERRLGAHPPDARRDPDPALLDRLLSAGRVRHVTLAPELPGALELIDLLVARGVTVSCGHSDATADEAHAAFARGATTVTHLFNAMRAPAAREPGLAMAALTHPGVDVQVILDGVHLAADTMRVVWRAAAGRVALVTDAIAGAGAPDGTYRLGAEPITVRDGIARRGDGTLAGSTLTMIDAVRNLVSFGVTLPEAVAAATVVPARIARRPDLGRLLPGAPADVVVLDDALRIRRVIVAGVERLAAA